MEKERPTREARCTSNEVAQTESPCQAKQEHPPCRIPMDDILGAVQADDYIGFCVACGAEHSGVEPDAKKYLCDECGKRAVYGAEELLLRITP